MNALGKKAARGKRQAPVAGLLTQFRLNMAKNRYSTMKFVILCACSLLAIAGCSTLPDKFTPTAEAWIAGDTLYYRGSIDAPHVLEAIRLARNSPSPISKLEINSGGGDIDAGMEFGLWVHQQNLAVVIDELCFSACANYIFPAARSVHLKSGAFVAWHGGAFQKTWTKPRWYEYFAPNKIERERKYLEGYLEYMRTKETMFFKTIGVDQKITTYGQDEAKQCQSNSRFNGWFYSLSDLKHMGLKDISLEDKEFSAKGSLGKLNACQLPELFGGS